MAVYVGRWDCTSCGYKGVLGPETECSNCSADRPKNVKFYLTDENDIVQDPELLKKARSGANWVCSYCTENNEASVSKCNSCGNNRNAAQGDKTLITKEYDTKNVPRSGDNSSPKKSQKTQIASKPPVKINKKGCIIALVVLVVLGLIFGQGTDITVTVTAFEWERTIKVEQRLKVEEEDWQVPSEGTLISSFRAIHHYNSILDHYVTRSRTKQRSVGTEQYVCGKKDMGNGYFEDKYCTRTLYESYQEDYQDPVYRKEAVYQTKYRYSVYRWKATKSALSSGGDHKAQWADINYIESDPNLRESERHAIYRIVVRDETNETHRHQIPAKEWEKLEFGDQLKATKGTVTGKYRGLADEKFEL